MGPVPGDGTRWGTATLPLHLRIPGSTFPSPRRSDLLLDSPGMREDGTGGHLPRFPTTNLITENSGGEAVGPSYPSGGRLASLLSRTPQTHSKFVSKLFPMLKKPLLSSCACHRALDALSNYPFRDSTYRSRSRMSNLTLLPILTGLTGKGFGEPGATPL